MDRRTFLRRALVGIGALSLGRLPPAPAEAGLVRDSILTSTNNFQIFGERLVASGGLCAPIEPYYSLVRIGRPVADLIPSFNAERGGVTYARFERE